MKRKYPARSSTRSDPKSKKRAPSPDVESSRSASGTPAPAIESVSLEETPTPLPSSIHPGQPLPTIETPQPEDLSNKDYQSYKDSGVLNESLSRSRNKWIVEGMFEKFWTKSIKPSKKKNNAPPEDPNNPSKDSMVKLGLVSITIEPHTFEATMYGVKQNKINQPPPAPAPPTNAIFRPILQYGPPNGVMPPKASVPPTPQISGSSGTPAPPQNTVPASPVHTSTGLAQAAAAPTAMNIQQAAPVRTMQAHAPTGSTAAIPGTSVLTPAPPLSQPGAQQSSQIVGQPSTSGTSGAAAAPAGRTPGPIIIALAERASSDEYLRDIMKKVAEGSASPSELAHFQQVIDDITVQHRKAAPGADQLFVDNRSVKYFADEVNVIIAIVLRSNPTQRAADLRPPNGSDPIVVALVRDALDNPSTRIIIHRIATNTQKYTDVQDLKTLLDRLHAKVQAEKARPLPVQASIPQAMATPPITVRQKLSQSSKPVPELSAVVFEFAGTNGDRYKFPKFSILNPIETKPDGSKQLVASFLIVRKGSTSEYGGDPELDYYQPMTIKITSPSGRHLENIPRVVAPEEEVSRYMDDIFDNMTRAEYILLAMRLPRPSHSLADRDDDVSMMALDDSRLGTPALAGPSQTLSANSEAVKNKPTNGVLWTLSTGTSNAAGSPVIDPRVSEEQEKQDKYQKLVSSAAAKEPPVVL